MTAQEYFEKNPDARTFTKLVTSIFDPVTTQLHLIGLISGFVLASRQEHLNDITRKRLTHGMMVVTHASCSRLGLIKSVREMAETLIETASRASTQTPDTVN